MADRNGLHAVAHLGLDSLAIGGVGLAVSAEHPRLARTVDVGIQDPDACPFGLQGQRQVDGHRGLTDAALAGGDGNDVLDIGLGFDAFLHGVGDDVAADVHRYPGLAGNGGKLCPYRLGQHVGVALRRKSQLDVDVDTIASDGDALDRLGADQVRAQIRVAEAGKRDFDLFFGDAAHGGSLRDSTAPILHQNYWCSAGEVSRAPVILV